MPKLKKPIYVDFDDVLSQTASTLLKVSEKEFNTATTYEAIISFDLQKSLNLNKMEWDRLMEISHTAEVLLSMPVIDGAAKALRQFHKEGHEIHIVTGRPPSTKNESVEWLKQYNVPYHEIFFADKYLRFDSRQKDYLSLDELKKNEYLFAIEDSAYMAEFIVQNMNTPVFLLDRPWNQKLNAVDSIHPIVRCKDWEGLIENCRGK